MSTVVETTARTLTQLPSARLRRLAVLATGLIFPLGLFGLWWISSTRGWLPEQILPAPSYVYQTGRDMILSGELPYHTGVSLARVVIGFTIGAALGLLLGIAMGLSETVEDYVKPLFLAFAQIPTLGWIPLLMLFVGIEETLKIIIIAKGAIVPMTLNTLTGIRGVSPKYIEVGRALRFSRWQTLRLIVLPGAIPSIFSGIRYGLTNSWTDEHPGVSRSIPESSIHPPGGTARAHPDTRHPPDPRRLEPRRFQRFSPPGFQKGPFRVYR